MNIAIEGCLHGQLEQVYTQLLQLQKKSKIKIDALIICGDFQATRDQIDLDFMHCPPKYKSLGSFQKYYTGEKESPFLTIFIGGNHQAVNYMRDLYFGGWVAPKIYYLGQAGSIYIRKGQFKVRVSGLSGIYNDYDFKYVLKSQRIPLLGKSRISSYHIKQIQIFRMQLLSRIQQMKKQDPQKYGSNHQNFDIFLTHDWPTDIALYGNTERLLQVKPFFREEIEKNVLGSLPSSRILKLAQPAYWFSAHLHVKYAALFPHPGNRFTHFLALDKCLQNRSCLQVLNFKNKNNTSQTNINLNQNTTSPQVSLQLDKTWLQVLKATIPLQLENRSLYKIQNNAIKLLDSKLMNSFIQQYSQNCKNKQYINFDGCEQFEKNLIKWKDQQQKGTEINQTVYLLESVLKQDPIVFNGIIFIVGKEEQIQMQKQNQQEKQKQQKQQQDKQIAKDKSQNNQDQIQLDL